jgi:hypothetical protein
MNERHAKGLREPRRPVAAADAKDYYLRTACSTMLANDHVAVMQKLIDRRQEGSRIERAAVDKGVQTPGVQ